MLTYEEITKSEAIKTYIIRADESLGALGFTEHSFATFSRLWGTMNALWNWPGSPDISTTSATW